MTPDALAQDGNGQVRPQITSMRVGNHPDKIRVVLDMTGRVNFRTFMLENPYRIVLDTSRVDWRLPTNTKGTQRGILKTYRYGLFQSNVSRLVLDLTEPAVIKSAELWAPRGGYNWRFVMDLVPSSVDKFRDEVARTANDPGSLDYENPLTRVADARQSETQDRRKIVVLDPGHGGVDPGALAKNGKREANIVLAVARRARKLLEETGKFRVVMTRAEDVYIPLRDRIQIAQQAGADLFISLHADSFKQASVRGASVYTLSNKASDKEAALLAERENKSDIIAGVSLEGYSPVINNILIDLAQRDTMNRSVVFARNLVPQLGKQVKMRKRPQRSAGFVVLKAPDVPSVLVELGYLSNPNDVSFLSSGSGQGRLAQAIRAAVLDYFYGKAY